MVTQGISALLGVWLMAAPAVLGYGGAASLDDRVLGPLALGCSVVAMHEVARPLRWINLALGLWLLAAPWLLHYGSPAVFNSIGTGLLLILLAPWRGRVRHAFGGGWSALWRSQAPPRPEEVRT